MAESEPLEQGLAEAIDATPPRYEQVGWLSQSGLLYSMAAPEGFLRCVNARAVYVKVEN